MTTERSLCLSMPRPIDSNDAEQTVHPEILKLKYKNIYHGSFKMTPVLNFFFSLRCYTFHQFPF